MIGYNELRAQIALAEKACVYHADPSASEYERVARKALHTALERVAGLWLCGAFTGVDLSEIDVTEVVFEGRYFAAACRDRDLPYVQAVGTEAHDHYLRFVNAFHAALRGNGFTGWFKSSLY